MESSLIKYVELFKKLNVSHRQGLKAPHKAILLLTVMSLIERGELCSLEIHYNDALVSRFKTTWNEYIGPSSVFNPVVTMPFWHLKNEKELWRLVPNESAPAALENLKVSTSLQAIRRYVKYAVIPEELFYLMQTPRYRAILSETLFESYIFT